MWIRVKRNAELFFFISKANFTKTAIKPKFFDYRSSLRIYRSANNQCTIQSPNFAFIENFYSCLTQAQNWVKYWGYVIDLDNFFCSGISYCLEFSTTPNSHATRENLPSLLEKEAFIYVNDAVGFWFSDGQGYSWLLTRFAVLWTFLKFMFVKLWSLNSA